MILVTRNVDQSHFSDLQSVGSIRKCLNRGGVDMPIIIYHARFAEAIRRLFHDLVKIKIFSIFRRARKIGDRYSGYVRQNMK